MKVLSVVGALRGGGGGETRALVTVLLHAVLSVTIVSLFACSSLRGPAISSLHGPAISSLHGPAISSLSPSQPKKTNIARLLLYCLL